MQKTTLRYTDKNGVKHEYVPEGNLYFNCSYSYPAGQFYIHLMDKADTHIFDIEVNIKYPKNLSSEMLEKLGLLEAFNRSNPEFVQDYMAMQVFAGNTEICMNCLAKNLAWVIETSLRKRRSAIIDCYNDTCKNKV